MNDTATTPILVDVDTEVTATVEWRDPDDQLADPGEVIFYTLAPDGTEANHTWPAGDGLITHVGLGLFSAIVVVDQPGTWWARFRSTTSGPITSKEGRIQVAGAHTP